MLDAKIAVVSLVFPYLMVYKEFPAEMLEQQDVVKAGPLLVCCPGYLVNIAPPK